MEEQKQVKVERIISDEDINKEKETQPQTDKEKQADKYWLEQEVESLGSASTYDGKKVPSLQFEENKIVEFDIDFSIKFDEWEDQANNCTKAIIPVKQGEEEKVLWLNKKNPLYKEICHAGMDGQTHFKVLQTGNKANTYKKYNLVKD